MKFKFLLLPSVMLLILFSCSKKNTLKSKFFASDNNIQWMDEFNVPEESVLINFNPASNQLDEVLSYTGIDPIGNFDIYLNTDNVKYSAFIATYTCPPNEDGKTLSSTNVELLDYQFYNGCFIYDLAKDSEDSPDYKQEKLSYDFAFDKKSRTVLKNDSIYFCLRKGYFNTFPIEASIGSYTINETSTLWSQDEPMVMFNMSLYTKDRVPHSNTYAILGFVSYDCNTRYDWDSVFKNQALATQAMTMSFKHPVNKSINLNDYKLIESD